MKLGDNTFRAYWRTAIETVDFMDYDLWLVGSLVHRGNGHAKDIDCVLTGPHVAEDIAYILNELKACGPFDVFYNLEPPVAREWNARKQKQLIAVPIQNYFPSLDKRGRVEKNSLLWYNIWLPSEKQAKVTKKTMEPVLVIQDGKPLYL